MRAGVVALALAACGRIDFGALSGDAGAGDVAPSGFCAALNPAPTFCDDFDEGQSVAAGWSMDQLMGGGQDTLTTPGHASATAAMHTFPMQTTGVTSACMNLT